MASDFYTEPTRQTPILADYEVIVCGGGPAGCAAAIAAARHGARTLLIEKEGYLGGATVSQLVIAILSTNGVDFQGIWHDFMRRLKTRNGVSELSHEREYKARRFAASDWIVGSVDPERVKYAWNDLLDETGADLLHHVLVAGAIVEDSAIRGILAETRAGRCAIMAQRIIDCTGDAAVCNAAGVPWQQGVAGRPWAMAVSKVARVAGVPVEPGDISGRGAHGVGRTSGRNMAIRMLGLESIEQINPLDPWGMTRAERLGRARIWQRVEDKRKQAGCEGIYLLDTSNQIGVRSSRRVLGLATATAADAWDLAKYPDGIARASWEIDIHAADDAGKESERWDTPQQTARRARVSRGGYFDIRYGCLVPQGVDNLLVAGRCISSEHEAQSSLRIQQTCLATGEAAGVAATLSLQAGRSPRQIDPQCVVAQLARDRDVEPAFEILKGLQLGE